MSNVIDNYYDRRIHFEEIIETDGQTLDSNPLRSIETDVLALVLFWNATGIAPTSEEGGSKYNYWCNIIREHTRRSFEYEPSTPLHKLEYLQIIILILIWIGIKK